MVAAVSDRLFFEGFEQSLIFPAVSLGTQVAVDAEALVAVFVNTDGILLLEGGTTLFGAQNVAFLICTERSVNNDGALFRFISKPLAPAANTRPLPKALPSLFVDLLIRNCVVDTPGMIYGISLLPRFSRDLGHASQPQLAIVDTLVREIGNHAREILKPYSHIVNLSLDLRT